MTADPALYDRLEQLAAAHEEWSTNGLDVDTTNGEVWNTLFRRPSWMDADDLRQLVALHNALPDLIAAARRAADLEQRVQALAEHWDTDDDARYAHNRIARSTAARALRGLLDGGAA